MTESNAATRYKLPIIIQILLHVTLMKILKNNAFINDLTFRGNMSAVKKEGTLAFSPENPLTRAATVAAMTRVATDNLGAFALFLDPTMLPPPKGFKDAKEMEKALTQPNAMKTILVGVEYQQSMAS